MKRKYTLNERAFTKWSPSMAYVLGFIYADGNMEYSPKIRGHYLRVTSSDRDRLTFIQKVLGSNHPLVEYKKAKEYHSTKHLLRIGSKRMYESLTLFGLHPAKSFSILFPEIPEKFLFHFVRGYFDGDGCVFIERRASKDGSRMNICRLMVVFTSGSRMFLQKLHRLLKLSGCTDKEKIYKNGRAFQMRLSTKESLVLYSLMYKKAPKDSFLKRKRQKFEIYIKERKLPK